MGDPHTHEFFRLLSLCHTVMSEEKNEGEPGAGLRSPRPTAALQPALWCGQVGPSRGLGWPLTPRVLFVPSQGSCTTKPSPRMRGPWSPRPGTSVLYSALAPPKPSLSTRWAQPSPTSCWPSWTSITSASGCQSSVRPGLGCRGHSGPRQGLWWGGCWVALADVVGWGSWPA